MTQVKTHISRRSFFKSTAVVGGGMLLGFNWLTACMPEEAITEALVLPDEWFRINAHIRIGDNGVVTIMSPNPEIGQNVKTSMPMVVAEELDIDWKRVVVEQAPLNDVFERQVAGGSQSIRQSWMGLRKAGATARHMLVAAAAARWGVDPSECTTSKGVISSPGGETLRYEEVATEAAGMEVPEEVRMKEPSEFTLIGTEVGNVDIMPIITGKPLFGIDTVKEGMQYAVAMRPPAFGQKLVSFDDTETRKVRGVTDVVQFGGNKIAVLANSTWAAIKGKKALRAQWAIDTPLESTAKHDEQLLPLLDKPAEEPIRMDGDVKQAFAEADQVVERIYEVPFLPHNPMEPMNFYADVREDVVELEGPTQTPASARRDVARVLDRDPSGINLMMTRQGGGFGRRLYNDFAEEAAEISSLAKKPVQLIFTREDDMMAGIYRPMTKYKLRAAIKDGQITGYHLTEAAVSRHMYDLIANFFPAGCLPNIRVEAHAIESNITTGAWRSPHTNSHAFAEQTFFDELAELLNLDPVQMRLDLLEKAKEAGEDANLAYEPERMQGVIRLAAEKSNWGKAPEGVFQGFAVYYCHNSYAAEVADVILKDGKPVLQKIHCAVDCGIVVNPLAARNQAQGGVIDGIGHALYSELTFVDGQPSSNNFDTYRLIRISEAPEVEIHFVKNEIDPTGLGEPPFPPAAPAFANAVYKATGKRLYKQPFVKELE